MPSAAASSIAAWEQLLHSKKSSVSNCEIPPANTPSQLIKLATIWKRIRMLDGVTPLLHVAMVRGPTRCKRCLLGTTIERRRAVHGLALSAGTISRLEIPAFRLSFRMRFAFLVRAPHRQHSTRQHTHRPPTGLTAPLKSCQSVGRE